MHKFYINLEIKNKYMTLLMLFKFIAAGLLKSLRKTKWL